MNSRKERTLVSVICSYSKQGEITPLYILWGDAMKYPCEVVRRQPAAIYGEKEGIRYVVNVGNHQQRILYFTEGKWYIEKPDNY